MKMSNLDLNGESRSDQFLKPQMFYLDYAVFAMWIYMYDHIIIRIIRIITGIKIFPLIM